MNLGPEDTKPQGNTEWLKTYKLDLQDTVSCDTVSCKNNATHYSHVRCCNAVVIGCADCLQGAFRLVISLIHANKPVKCKNCGEVCNPKNWLSKPEELALTV